MHGRLHGCQHVLGAMLGLASENGDLRLATLALGNVAGDFRCADDLAVGSLTGETVSEMSTQLPSLRRRTVS